MMNEATKRVTRGALPMVPAMLVVTLTALGASACASARAQTEPESTALAVPAPPARVLPPLEGARIEAAVPTAAEPSTEGRPRRATGARHATYAGRDASGPAA